MPCALILKVMQAYSFLSYDQKSSVSFLRHRVAYTLVKYAIMFKTIIYSLRIFARRHTLPVRSCWKMASKLQWRTAVSPTATVVVLQMNSTEFVSRLTSNCFRSTAHNTSSVSSLIHHVCLLFVYLFINPHQETEIITQVKYNLKRIKQMCGLKGQHRAVPAYA